jgi:hypothetical protein
MDPIGHWALGFILGTLIILPFIKERLIYDYTNQKWVSVKWQELTKESNKWMLKQSRHQKEADIISHELHPLTSSKFFLYHFIIANICGVIALLPDIGQLWGNTQTDHQWWSNIFFFHRVFDSTYLGTANPISFETLLFGTAIGVWVMTITLAWYLQYDKKPVESVLV